MPTYVVERYLPALPPAELRADTAREREAMAHASSDVAGVKYLRSMYLREDELCFSFVEAPSVDAVREAYERAGLPFERITEAIDVAGETKG